GGRHRPRTGSPHHAFLHLARPLLKHPAQLSVLSYQALLQPDYQALIQAQASCPAPTTKQYPPLRLAGSVKLPLLHVAVVPLISSVRLPAKPPQLATVGDATTS